MFNLIKGHVFLSLILVCSSVFADSSPTVVKPLDTADNTKSYNYFFRGGTLENTLNKYAQIKGLRIHYATLFPKNKLSKLVSGKINVSNDDELLNNLAVQFGFEWFISSGTLYISSNQEITRTISVSPQNMPNIKLALQQSGLLNSKFGYSELPYENKIIITGPEDYIKIILTKISGFNVAPVAQQFAVFRLKYANAVDTQVSFNNQQILRR